MPSTSSCSTGEDENAPLRPSMTPTCNLDLRQFETFVVEDMVLTMRYALGVGKLQPVDFERMNSLTDVRKRIQFTPPGYDCRKFSIQYDFVWITFELCAEGLLTFSDVIHIVNDWHNDELAYMIAECFCKKYAAQRDAMKRCISRLHAIGLPRGEPSFAKRKSCYNWLLAIDCSDEIYATIPAKLFPSPIPRVSDKVARFTGFDELFTLRFSSPTKSSSESSGGSDGGILAYGNSEDWDDNVQKIVIFKPSKRRATRVLQKHLQHSRPR